MASKAILYECFPPNLQKAFTIDFYIHQGKINRQQKYEAYNLQMTKKTSAFKKIRQKKKPICNQKTYLLQQILDVRLNQGQRQYLIKWKDYSQEDNTWEPLANLEYVLQEVAAFEKDKKQHIVQMEKAWIQLYNAGQVKKPLEPFCYKAVELKINKSSTQNIFEQNQEEINKQLQSDSDYQSKATKKRKAVKKQIKSNKKARNKKPKVRSNHKTNVKKARNQYQQSNKQDKIRQNIVLHSIENEANEFNEGRTQEDKNAKNFMQANEYQSEVKQTKFLVQHKNNSQQIIGSDFNQIIEASIKQPQQLIISNIKLPIVVIEKNLQSALESSKVQKTGIISNQYLSQQNKNQSQQIKDKVSLQGQNNPKTVQKPSIETQIEQSRRDTDQIHNKSSINMIQTAIVEPKVNLGGCSNFPVARSIRKYTYVHKKNTQKPNESKEPNEIKPSSAQEVKDGKPNTQDLEKICQSDQFCRLQDSQSNPCILRPKSQSLTLCKTIQFHQTNRIISAKPPLITAQEQQNQYFQKRSLAQQAQQAPDQQQLDSKVYSVLSHSKNDFGPTLSINDSFGIKIEPFEIKDNKKLRSCNLIRDSSRFLSQNNTKSNHYHKNQCASKIVEISSDESSENCKNITNSIKMGQFYQLKQFNAINHRQHSKFSQHSEASSFQGYCTPKRKIINKKYIPSRTSHRQGSQDSVYHNTRRNWKINGLSAQKLPIPKLTFVIDRLISQQLLRHGYRPAIRRIVDNFEIDGSSIFQVEIKGKNGHGELFASYESLRSFYPKKLLEYLEKTGSIQL